MSPVKIGLLGLGTVGGGTATVLSRNREEITRRAGREIVIDYAAALDPSRAEELGLTARITADASAVVSDADIDIVVELIGGTTVAKDLVLQAIENGKHVVTANKALIALHGEQIFQAAQSKGVMVAFEAAVGGGIPVIKSVREGLGANKIQWLAGIINGTGNFILTEMRDKGREFGDVLAEAQALGYAEADPTFDVEGIDAAHKLTILSSMAFGVPLQFDRTYTEGISQITADDVRYADELNLRIKHLGIARKTEQGIEQRVHPTLLPKNQLLANVNGVMNAVLIHGDAVGSTLYYGAGAGAEPTASAVIADIVDVVRAMTTDPERRVPHLAFQAGQMDDTPILNIDQVESGYYMRLRVKDQPGVLADITRILADHNMSVQAFLQKQPEPDQAEVDIILVTYPGIEGNFNAALGAIEALDCLTGEVVRIRVASLE